MNEWLLYIIIFVIGLLFLLFGMASRRKMLRAVGLTSMVLMLIIAAVLIFVNKQSFVLSEVFSFIK